MRRAARVDDNQADVVRALRGIGASVQSLAMVGKGCPDLLVGYRGNNHLLEVKDGDKVPSKRALTKSERDWHDGWGGAVHVVTDAIEAIEVVSGQKVKRPPW